MFEVRKANERGQSDHGWLKANFTFSFASYYDPRYMGFRSLRVINNDHIMPDSGFPTHPHRDMEIISFILEGTIKHKDSMGNEKEIKKGEIQVMSAGTGIAHSEFNPSSTEKTQMYQIWIEPDAKGYAPNYGQVSYEQRKLANQLTLLVDRKGDNGALKINQNAQLFYGQLEAGNKLDYRVSRGYVWLQVFKGEIEVLGQKLGLHDGMSISEEEAIEISSNQESEFLLFDLA